MTRREINLRSVLNLDERSVLAEIGATTSILDASNTPSWNTIFRDRQTNRTAWVVCSVYDPLHKGTLRDMSCIGA